MPKCSLCGQEGHNKSNKKFHTEEERCIKELVRGVLTNLVKGYSNNNETFGKLFERAICIHYGITYNNNDKYSIDTAIELSNKLSNLKLHWPPNYNNNWTITHTGPKSNAYDFTATHNRKGNVYLSAKTSKKDYKVAVQEIGQVQPKRFCDILRQEHDISIKYRDETTLKRYIQENILLLLPILEDYTFKSDTQVLCYFVKDNSLKLFKKIKKFNWDKYDYKWTSDWNVWNEGCTLKLNNKAVLEWQFHKKSRTCMKIRFDFGRLMDVFGDHLKIIDL